MSFSKYDVDNAFILVAVLLILIVVLAAAAGALDLDDTKSVRPLVPTSVYQHPEEEP